MEIKKVGVLGCGLMGSGIAQVCAQSGYDTLVREVNSELLQKGLDGIRKFASKMAEKGQLKISADEVMKNLRGTTRLEDMADRDLIIEAVPEILDLKRSTFTTLSNVCREDVILSSNTSSLSIVEMAVVAKHPERFLGLHFFNPVPRMELVEVVKTIVTSQEVFDQVFAFAGTLGKKPIAATDKPGFIVNRLLVPYLLDAIRAYEEGFGSIEDIDKGMQLGCGYPMGPFTLLDFVGLDTTVYIANIMFDEFKDPRFAPPTLLKRMVMVGQYGRKSGKGFYDYSKK
ncbi:MAG TPA: 3-hydroxybutyryl-CoA dehydrogenase [Acidobacteriota bacterium]|nr:3-hydroxybutyryl-CoA dehydrogenase [Acidobacteriota bacterium]